MADGSQSLQGVCVCSVMSLFRSPWTVADQASLTMEFSRQGYWSELFFPSPRDLLDPGIRLMHGTLLIVMWQPGWEGSLEESGYMYMYG